jgi:hypothetical protein
MTLRASRVLLGVLFVSFALSGATSACGGDDVPPPPPDGDAGHADGGDAGGDAGDADGGDAGGDAGDAGLIDASIDGGEVDANVCIDADGDGYFAASCGGDDCDDTLSSVHPGAAEVCNGMDDDCDGTADDGVCLPCAAGYTGVDDACTDVDECALAATCGAARESCANVPGTYVCGCLAGYSAPIIGGTCADIDECVAPDFCGTGATLCTDRPGTFECTCGPGYAAATPTGAFCENVDECAAAMNPCGAGTCTDNAGSYVCGCPAGYRLVSSPSITCVDIDECAEGTHQCIVAPPAALCANTPGSYTCTCSTGYEGTGRSGTSCTNIDECARGLDDCSADAACADTVGSFTCTCAAGFVGAGHGAGGCADVDECATSTQCGRTLGGGAVNGCTDSSGGYTCACGAGFAASGAGFLATCVDIDECATGLNDCESVVATCANTSGGFDCPCATGFVGTGHGAGSCRWNDPSLAGLTPGAGGTLSPAFAPGTTMYTVTLPAGETSITLTPTVALPTRATITVDGTVTASNASATASVVGFAPRVVSVVVTTETGATRTYTVVVRLGSTYVKASNAAMNDWFGMAVSLSADGTRLAVGAHLEASSATGMDGNQTDNTAGGSGAVYVFSLAGTTWTQEAYVKASNTGISDAFGWSVSLSADGTRLAVGAYGEDSSATGVGGNQADNTINSSGAVYVFSRTGTTWTQEAYVKASNTGANDWFGYSVSLSSDGTRLAVGAPYEASSATGVDGNQADDTTLNSGAVYVFSRSGATWTQEAYVKASNTGGGDQFGGMASLSSDGTRLAVGAHYEASSATGVGGNQADNSAAGSGAVYLFSRTGTTWTQEAYVKASNMGGNDFFGYSLSLSSDGTRLAVGAYGEDSAATGVGGSQANNSAINSGAVYVFSRTGTTWTQEAYIKASATGPSDQFGYSVSLSADGTRLAVGALLEASSATGVGGNQVDNSAFSSGAVYVFARTGTTWAQEAYVKASNTEANDDFGGSLSLSADGTRLAVGAYKEDSSATGVGGNQADNAAGNSGAVYVY